MAPHLTLTLLLVPTLFIATSMSSSVSSNMTSTGTGGRVLGVFQVTKFPNDECSAANNKVLDTSRARVNHIVCVQGVCLSGSECDARGGVILGSCAQGFGSCCAVYISSCTSDNFRHNLTYIVSPGPWWREGVIVYW